MRAETRHSLKQDRFRGATIDAAEATVHWTVEHKGKLSAAVAIVVVVVAAIAGGWYYLNLQDEKASLAVSQAVRILDTPVRPANMPPQPDQPSYASVKERASEAQKKFQAVIDQYPHTHAADVSKYFVGITANDQGDSTTAEADLKAVTSTRNDDLAALAKMALASVYRNTSRVPQAVELYKQIINKPTHSVGKVTAEMELAATYEASNQPLEAKRIYEQIQKDSPTSEAAQMAAARIRDLK